MKSLLVDAIRQAKFGDQEQSLSDSGSFDTTRSEIPETANDAVIEPDGDDAEALRLYETSASLEAAVSDADDDADFFNTNELVSDNAGKRAATGPLRPAASAPLISVRSSGPYIARFAPLACVTLAALAAMSWSGYQHLKLKYAESEFAAAQVGGTAARAPERDGAVSLAVEQRFPFINAAKAASDAEKVE